MFEGVDAFDGGEEPDALAVMFDGLDAIAVARWALPAPGPLKGALFLRNAAFAAGASQRPVFVVIAAALGLSLAGLPFTGGALAKEAIRDSLGYGLAGQLANPLIGGERALDAALRDTPALGLAEGRGASVRRSPSWPLAICRARREFPPSLLYPAVGGFRDALGLDKIWDGLWPILLGALAFAALASSRRLLPAVPQGDTIGVFEAAFRGLLRFGAAFDRVDATFRQSPGASLALVARVPNPG